MGELGPEWGVTRVSAPVPLPSPHLLSPCGRGWALECKEGRVQGGAGRLGLSPPCSQRQSAAGASVGTQTGLRPCSVGSWVKALLSAPHRSPSLGSRGHLGTRDISPQETHPLRSSRPGCLTQRTQRHLQRE